MKLSNEGQLPSWFQVKDNVRQAIIISILLRTITGDIRLSLVLFC